MSITLNRENGKITIQNRFYTIAFNIQVGGVVNHLRNRETERSLVFREGCEIWCPKWGGFTANHYQQERTGKPKYEIRQEAEVVKLKIENLLGNAGSGRTQGGWCINNWVFKKDTPLIHCSAQIGDPEAEQVETAKPNLFKKYICFRPGNYKYWAYKEEGEVVSGLLGWRNLMPHFTKGGNGYYFILKRGWITLFNENRGFALINKTCDQIMFWQSKSMEELLCSNRSREKSNSLSLDYLDYATTPEKKWNPVADIYE